MTLKACLFTALLSLAGAACATPAAAWELLGVREVRDRVERDTIRVEGPRRHDRIRLCVYRNPVHFIDLDVRYRNGTRQDVTIRRRINPGDCTRAIDLVGNDRNIVSVTMLYEETSVRRRTATVRLFGQ